MSDKELATDGDDGFDWDRLAKGCGVRVHQARAVAELADGGATVPFMARYRKEATGGLDEVWIRLVLDAREAQKTLEKRRTAVLASLEERGVTEAGLLAGIRSAATLPELEDLYAPYRQKRKTRAETARERGLAPLAEQVRKLARNPSDAAGAKALEKALADLAGSCPELDSPQAVKDGVVDILAEEMSHQPALRALVKDQVRARGGMVTKPKLKGEEWEKSPYRQYGEFREGLARIKPHQWLALRRGEKEGHLSLKWDLEQAGLPEALARELPGSHPLWVQGREEALDRHLVPLAKRDRERSLDNGAEQSALDTFQGNLRPLLMGATLKGRRILAIDPGLRTGCKAVGLDPNGEMLGWFTFYTRDADDAAKAIAQGIKKYHSDLVVVGNGTGSEAVQDAVALVLQTQPDLQWTIVAEDGASVYSASDAAREEFPDLDVSIRGAVSLGRRVIDPLSELVKIDPRSLGVGMYQHDVDPKRLESALDHVVEDVVNQVGVIAPAASAHLLRHVSGLGPALAKKIVDYRSTGGVFRTRRDLLKVPGLGAKTYEQCAGFLKFPDSPEALDNTWVHPESYPLARKLKDHARAGTTPSAAERKALCGEFSVTDAAIDTILQELRRPNRSPRDEAPLPPMYTRRRTFEDLEPGEILTGQVKNLVDFGAFVDLGIKEAGLCHISEMCDRFIRHPSEALQVGQVLEFRIKEIDRARRRIALSRKGM